MYLAGGVPSKHEDISASAVTLEQVGANQKATFGEASKVTESDRFLLFLRACRIIPIDSNSWLERSIQAKILMCSRLILAWDLYLSICVAAVSALRSDTWFDKRSFLSAFFKDPAGLAPVLTPC